MKYYDKDGNPIADADVDNAGAGSGAAIAAALAVIANALGVSTDAGAGAGASGALAATDTQNKTDVNVPEAITSYNAMLLQNAVMHSKRVDNMGEQIIQNAITQANNIVTNAQESANLVSKQAIRHTDLAIDREWNPDEVAALFAVYFGRLAATQNNPIPPKDE